LLQTARGNAAADFSGRRCNPNREKKFSGLTGKFHFSQVLNRVTAKREKKSQILMRRVQDGGSAPPKGVYIM
jgi:hypothetical protein